MFSVVETRDVSAVEGEVQRIYLEMFPQGNRRFVPDFFGSTVKCFTGNYRDYQPIDARYHDLEHTMQGTLCMSRLLWGRWKAQALPPLTQRMFELGLVAILFHDTGYLKTDDDMEGTGAKYTLTHVTRSADFCADFLREKGFPQTEIASVQNMIRCTGVNTDLSRIPFHDELERIVGFALGTADLIGQMAAPDYIEKLPVLYQEFAESVNYEHSRAMFTSALDLMQKTPGFWAKYVQPKIDHDFLGLYRYLGEDPASPSNFYIDRILSNIERLKGQLTAVAA